MSERSVMTVFAGFVVAGVALGLLAVLVGVPVKTGAAVVGTAETLPKVPIPSKITSDPYAPPPSTGATGSAAGTGSAEVTSTDEGTGKQPMDQPARLGAPLAIVDNPPPDTLALMDPGSATAGSTYDVTFAPYGIGPGEGQNQQLIIKILTSTPQPGLAKPFAFAGRNALVGVTPDAAGIVTVGGQYQGTLTMVDQQGLFVPMLGKVTVLRIRK